MKKAIKTTLLLSLLSLSFGCAQMAQRPEDQQRGPASLTAQEEGKKNEAQQFIQEIEQAPARHY